MYLRGKGTPAPWGVYSKLGIYRGGWFILYICTYIGGGYVFILLNSGVGGKMYQLSPPPGGIFLSLGTYIMELLCIIAYIRIMVL